MEEVGSEGGRESARTTVAVDEFGVGNSTLAMLQRYPVDTIKIDRSFMRDLTSPVGQPLPPAEFAELLSDLPLDIAYEAECRA